MKYVIVNYTENETTVFEYEVENPEELFRFIKVLNSGDRFDEFEIEVWEYPEEIPFETMMRLSSSNDGKVTFHTLWDNELLGEQILGKYVDKTGDKINVLLEER